MCRCHWKLFTFQHFGAVLRVYKLQDRHFINPFKDRKWKLWTFRYKPVLQTCLGLVFFQSHPCLLRLYYPSTRLSAFWHCWHDRRTIFCPSEHWIHDLMPLADLAHVFCIKQSLSWRLVDAGRGISSRPPGACLIWMLIETDRYRCYSSFTPSEWLDRKQTEVFLHGWSPSRR